MKEYLAIFVWLSLLGSAASAPYVVNCDMENSQYFDTSENQLTSIPATQYLSQICTLGSDNLYKAVITECTASIADGKYYSGTPCQPGNFPSLGVPSTLGNDFSFANCLLPTEDMTGKYISAACDKGTIDRSTYTGTPPADKTVKVQACSTQADIGDNQFLELIYVLKCIQGGFTGDTGDIFAKGRDFKISTCASLPNMITKYVSQLCTKGTITAAAAGSGLVSTGVTGKNLVTSSCSTTIVATKYLLDQSVSAHQCEQGTDSALGHDFKFGTFTTFALTYLTNKYYKKKRYAGSVLSPDTSNIGYTVGVAGYDNELASCTNTIPTGQLLKTQCMQGSTILEGSDAIFEIAQAIGAFDASAQYVSATFSTGSITPATADGAVPTFTLGSNLVLSLCYTTADLNGYYLADQSQDVNKCIQGDANSVGHNFVRIQCVTSRAAYVTRYGAAALTNKYFSANCVSATVNVGTGGAPSTVDVPGSEAQVLSCLTSVTSGNYLSDQNVDANKCIQGDPVNLGHDFDTDQCRAVPFETDAQLAGKYFKTACFKGTINAALSGLSPTATSGADYTLDSCSLFVPTGKYLLTQTSLNQCVQGTINSPGHDFNFGTCDSLPTLTNSYVKTLCVPGLIGPPPPTGPLDGFEGTNLVTQACSTSAPSGQYYKANIVLGVDLNFCTKGDGSTLGQDFIFTSCTASSVANGNYISAVCFRGNFVNSLVVGGMPTVTGGSDRVVTGCATSSNFFNKIPIDGKYIADQGILTNTCEKGTNSLAGHDFVVGTCTTAFPTVNHFVLTPCQKGTAGSSNTATSGADTVFKLKADFVPTVSIQAGNYRSSFFSSGSPLTSAGTDDVISACSNPSDFDNDWVKTKCFVGSDTALGTDTDIRSKQAFITTSQLSIQKRYRVSNYSPGWYHVQGYDNVAPLCSQPIRANGEYTTAKCVFGSTTMMGTNTVFGYTRPDSPCSDNPFVFITQYYNAGDESTVGTPLQTTPCSTANSPTYYYSVGCQCTWKSSDYWAPPSLANNDGTVLSSPGDSDIQNNYDLAGSYMSQVFLLGTPRGGGGQPVDFNACTRCNPFIKFFNGNCDKGTFPSTLGFIGTCSMRVDLTTSHNGQFTNKKYLSATYVQGNWKTPGSDDVYSPCNEAQSGSYQYTVCTPGTYLYQGYSTPGTSGVVNSCSNNDVPCIQGDYKTKGTNGDCVDPPAGYYTTIPCNAANGIATQHNQCQSIPDGKFVSFECVAGNYNTAGSQSTLSNCYGVPSLQVYLNNNMYVKELCFKQIGDAYSIGFQGDAGYCVNPSKSEYYAQKCVLGSLTITGSGGSKGNCVNPAAGTFISSACVRGSTYSGGVDGSAGSTSACTLPVDGQYVGTACVAGAQEISITGTDVVPLPCAVPADGFYMSTACDKGTVGAVGSAGTTKNCYVRNNSPSDSHVLFTSDGTSGFVSTVCNKYGSTGNPHSVGSPVAVTSFTKTFVAIDDIDPTSYRFSHKTTGSYNTLGSDDVIRRCTEPILSPTTCSVVVNQVTVQGLQYVSTLCNVGSGDSTIGWPNGIPDLTTIGDGTDTVISCDPSVYTQIKAGEYRSTLFAPGASTKLGTSNINTRCIPDATYSLDLDASKWGGTPTISTSWNDVQANVVYDTTNGDNFVPDGYYINTGDECVQGNSNRLGNKPVASKCTTFKMDGNGNPMYVSTPCVKGTVTGGGGKDTEFLPCTIAVANEYYSQRCKIGNYNTAGFNSNVIPKTTQFTLLVGTHYITKIFVQGKVLSGSKIDNASDCGAWISAFFSGAALDAAATKYCTGSSFSNTGGVNDDFALCTTNIASSDYVDTPCSTGTWGISLGSNTVTKPCKVTTSPNDYYTKICVQGNSAQQGSDSDFKLREFYPGFNENYYVKQIFEQGSINKLGANYVQESCGYEKVSDKEFITDLCDNGDDGRKGAPVKKQTCKYSDILCENPLSSAPGQKVYNTPTGCYPDPLGSSPALPILQDSRVTAKCFKGVMCTSSIDPSTCQTGKTKGTDTQISLNTNTIVVDANIPKSKYRTSVHSFGNYNTFGVDDVLADCSVPVPHDSALFFKYAKTLCYTGDRTTLGKDTLIVDCTEPQSSNPAQYTKATCKAGSYNDQGFDTNIESCLLPSGTVTISKTCVRGNSHQQGSNSETTGCKTSEFNKYVTKLCTIGVLYDKIGDQTEFEVCPEPVWNSINGIYEYVDTPCDQGNYLTTIGKPTVIKTCDKPKIGTKDYIGTDPEKLGQYVTKLCVRTATITADLNTAKPWTKGSNTEFADRTAFIPTLFVTIGFWRSSIYGAGNAHLTLGSNDIATTKCTLPTDAVNPTGTWVFQPCVIDVHTENAEVTGIGSDTVLKPRTTYLTASNIVAGKYRSSLYSPGWFNVLGRDDVISLCATPIPGQYIPDANKCVKGTDNTLGTNSVPVDCKVPIEGVSYTSVKCVAGSYNGGGSNSETKDRSILTRAGNQYWSQIYAKGDYNIFGRDDKLETCSNPSLGYYTSTPCDKGKSYEQGGVAGLNTKFTNRASPHTPTAVQYSQYYSKIYYPGTIDNNGWDQIISVCTPPAAGKYVTAVCVRGNNEADINTGMATTNAVIGSNTATSGCSLATPLQYVTSACVQGSTSLKGSDVVFNGCKVPEVGYFVKSKCTLTNDGQVTGSNTVTLPCSRPQEHQYVVTPCFIGTVGGGGGVDTVIANCKTPSPTSVYNGQTGDYVTKLCIAGDFLTIGGGNSQTNPRSGWKAVANITPGQYRSKIFYAGWPYTTSTQSAAVGNDDEFHECTKPVQPGTDGQVTSYVDTICLVGDDTDKGLGSNSITKPRTNFILAKDIPEGQYRKSFYNPGYYNVRGNDDSVVDCTTPGLNQYVTSLCIKGDDVKVGTDTGIASCFMPGVNQFVSKKCEAGDRLNIMGSQTQFGECLTKAEQDSLSDAQGYYVDKTCAVGAVQNGLTGSKATTAQCSMPGLNKLVKVVCKYGAWNDLGANTVTSDRVMTLPKEVPNGQYIKSLYTTGDYKTLGTDLVIEDCAKPEVGKQYVTKVCVVGKFVLDANDNKAGSNTEIMPRTAYETVIPDGKWRSSLYYPGFISAVGSDDKLDLCTFPADNQYVSVKCFKGTRDTEGTNTQFSSCTSVGFDNSNTLYVTKVCDQGHPVTTVGAPAVETIRTAFTPTASILDGNYRKALWSRGSWNQLGVDDIIAPCTAPSSAQYVNALCNKGTDVGLGIDTGFANKQAFISPVPPTKWRSSIYKSGNFNTFGLDNQLATCSYLTSPDVPNGKFVENMCDQGQGASEDIAQAGADTVVKDCKVLLDPNSKITKACIIGSFNVQGFDTVIDGCSSIPSDHYVTAKCNRLNGIDATFSPCKKPAPHQFVTKKCDQGDTLTAIGSNSEVADCDVPIVGEPTGASGSFTTSICIQGGILTSVGTNSVVKNRTGFLETSLMDANTWRKQLYYAGNFNELGRDDITQKCTLPEVDPTKGQQFVTSVCVKGTDSSIGVDTQLKLRSKFIPVNLMPDGQYRVRFYYPGYANKLGSDDVVGNCLGAEIVLNGVTGVTAADLALITIPKGSYVKETCYKGTDNVDNGFGKNTVIVPCKAPQFNEWVTSICTTGDFDTLGANDAVILPCSNPSSDSKYVTDLCVSGSAGIIGSDTIIADCYEPLINEFTTVACSPGSFNKVGSDTVKKFCLGEGDRSDEISLTHYYTKECFKGSYKAPGFDAEKARCKIPDDTVAVDYVKVICNKGTFSSRGSNTVLEGCGEPSTTQYVDKICIFGDNAISTGVATQFLDCKTPITGEYVSTVCSHGSSLSPGSNSETSPCSNPIDGFYVKLIDLCSQGDVNTQGKNTVPSPCSNPNPSTINMVTKVCDAGTFESAGEDTTFETCKQPADDEFVPDDKKCLQGSYKLVGTDTIPQPCARPTSNEYVTAQCIQGTPVGGGGATTVKVSCPTPTFNIATSTFKYTITPCFNGDFNLIGAQTIIGTCKSVVDDYYVTNVCVPGNELNKGSNTVTAPCTQPNFMAKEYVTSLCNTGKTIRPDSLGKNTKFGICLEPLVEGFTVTTCKPGNSKNLGTQTLLALCLKPAPGLSYTVKACVGGDYKTEGSISAILDCKGPVNGEYVKDACLAGTYGTLGANTNTVPCLNPISGTNFVTKVCTPGTSTLPGSNTLVSPCSTIAAGMFVKSTCKAGSITSVGIDLDTGVCSEPTALQYVAASCVPGTSLVIGSNTLSSTCALPSDSQYVKTKCVNGSKSVVGTNTVIIACTPPTNTQYVTAVCVTSASNGLGTDAKFSDCSIPADGQYTTAHCVSGGIKTLGSNTVFSSCTNPKTTGDFIEFVSSKCVAGAIKALGTDTVVSQCTIKESGQTVKSECVAGDYKTVGADTVIVNPGGSGSTGGTGGNSGTTDTTDDTLVGAAPSMKPLSMALTLFVLFMSILALLS